MQTHSLYRVNYRKKNTRTTHKTIWISCYGNKQGDKKAV